MKSYTGTRKHKEVKTPIKGYRGNEIIQAMTPITKRLLIGIPATGLIRIEWALARWGQIIPCNWASSDIIQFLDQFSPMGFMVADARNLIATKAVEQDFEWLWFIDHDTLPPPHTALTWNEYMIKGDIPVFGGLYFTKGVPSEPLVYRGNGTGYFAKWKLGEKVWVDGIGMGNTMIHVSILKEVYKNSEAYQIGPNQVRRIFQTPSRVGFDPQNGGFYAQGGTEDLFWCDRLQREDIFKKAGWKDIAKKKYPFLIDTNVFCPHIDNNGTQYPSKGEERQFLK